MPHVLEPFYVDTQLLCHKLVRADDHESLLLPHPLLCNSRASLSTSRLAGGYS